MTYTPGEWNHDMMPGHIFSTLNGEEILIAKLSTVGPKDELSANARLIAAAPELLEALYTALNLEQAVKMECNVGLDIEYHFDKIRAAIAAAEGRP